MSERTTNCHRFKGIKSLAVQADFRGGDVTSDAGLLLLRAANHQTELLTEAAHAIIDTRHPSYIDHDIETMLTQRVFGIACGYEDGNDHSTLRKDPMFQIAANKVPGEEALASPSTLCRLEKAINKGDLVRLARVLVKQFISRFKKAPKVLTLDFDSTDDRVHGHQEFAYFNKFYDGYCYLPLYVFCGGHLLVAYLRPSNKDGARHAWAILALLVKMLREAWPRVVIRWRADSGFCRPRILSWCERNGIEYIVGLPGNARLEKAAAGVFIDSEIPFLYLKRPVETFDLIEYAADTWGKKRKVVVKVARDAEGAKARYLVTNSSEKDAKKLYKKTYAKRGDMENRIKEQQLGLFADRTSCQRFLGNQFRLLLSSFAYVLMEYVRQTALAGTEFAAAQCSTIRTKLLKIGAVIMRNTRRIQIHVAGHYPYQHIFHHAARCLTTTG